MSHNKISINGATPNTSGELEITLDTLASGASTPSDQEVLQTDAQAAWTKGGLSAASVDVVANTSAAYTGGGTSWNYLVNDYMIFHKNTLTLQGGVSYLKATGTYTPNVTNSNYYRALVISGSVFNGKTIIVRASLAPDCQATCVVQWGIVSYSNLNSFTPIGPKARIDSKHSDIAWGRLAISDTNNYPFALRMVERTGSSSQIQVAGFDRAAHYSIDIKAF